MSVIVTQGHELGIGLEVFLKSCLFLSQRELDEIELVTFKSSLELTLQRLHYPYQFEFDTLYFCQQKIKCHFPKRKKFSESLTCLHEAIERIHPFRDVLLTLPTSKDQFNGFSGHTEFFRHHYKKNNLTMFFSSPSLQILLLTDHVAINKLSSTLTTSFMVSRLKLSLKTLSEWKWNLGDVYLAGFNPHCGENGLMGSEDQRISRAINQLETYLKKERIFSVNPFIKGPYSGDSVLFEKKSKDDLLVYLYHDQGLGVFKGLQGFLGSNITLGLPFPRLSPDHGTSFSMFGKNKADYRGCEYTIKLALHLNKQKND